MRTALVKIENLLDIKDTGKMVDELFPAIQAPIVDEINSINDRLDFLTFPAIVNAATLSDCERCCDELEIAINTIKETILKPKSLFHKLHKRFSDLEKKSIENLQIDLNLYKKRIAEFLRLEKEKEENLKLLAIKDIAQGASELTPVAPAIAGKIYDSKVDVTYSVADMQKFLQCVINKTLPEGCVEVKVKPAVLKKTISIFGWDEEQLKEMGILATTEFKVRKKGKPWQGNPEAIQ